MTCPSRISLVALFLTLVLGLVVNANAYVIDIKECPYKPIKTKTEAVELKEIIANPSIFRHELCSSPYRKSKPVLVNNEYAFIENGEFVEIIEYIGEEANVRIPSQINGKSVAVIWDYAFANKQLTSVTIPSSVTEIGYLAFDNNNITKFNVASGNKAYIVKNSFLLSKDETLLIGYYGNKKNITIPNGVTTIKAGAFQRAKLISVIIPNSVTEIEKFAFHINELESVIIPSGVTAIGDWAFLENPLKSITIGANVPLVWSSSGIGAFDYEFCSTYNSGGKQAGTYVLREGKWVRE